MALVEFDRIVHKFGDELALNELSFTLPENKVVGLIGANGAGKTTAIRHMIRYLKPDSGDITYRGEDIYGISNERYPITYIPDSSIFYEELTVMEHLQFVAVMYGTKEKISSLVSRMELKKHLSKYPMALSKGTRQKLSIACALLRTHELLIADEPFSGLDPGQIKVLKDIMLEEKSAGRTVLLLTHLLEVIENICDYYIFIDEGKLVTQGTFEDLTQGTPWDTLEKLYIHLARNNEEVPEDEQ